MTLKICFCPVFCASSKTHLWSKLFIASLGDLQRLLCCRWKKLIFVCNGFLTFLTLGKVQCLPANATRWLKNSSTTSPPKGTGFSPSKVLAFGHYIKSSRSQGCCALLPSRDPALWQSQIHYQGPICPGVCLKQETGLRVCLQDACSCLSLHSTSSQQHFCDKTPKQKGDVWIFWYNQDDILKFVSLFIPGFTVASAFASVGFVQPFWEHWTPGEPHPTTGAPSWKERLSLVSMLPRKQHPELPFLIIQHILTSEQLYITSEAQRGHQGKELCLTNSV